MRSYFSVFFRNGQKGIETIEFIGLVVVAAVLIGVVAAIGTTMAGRANTSQAEMENALNQLDEVAKAAQGN